MRMGEEKKEIDQKNGMNPWAEPYERNFICHADGGKKKKYKY